jgi:Mrp family chromosome partitioning ATPase
VVDADFENPNLAERCGISPQLGWGEVIDGDLPFAEGLVAAIEDGVTIMPWRGPAGRLAQRTAALRATTGFRLLREHFDLVILDAMPLSAPSANTELSALATVGGPCSAYLVRDPRTTRPPQVASGLARLGRSAVHVAGIIENFSHAEP